MTEFRVIPTKPPNLSDYCLQNTKNFTIVHKICAVFARMSSLAELSHPKSFLWVSELNYLFASHDVNAFLAP